MKFEELKKKGQDLASKTGEKIGKSIKTGVTKIEESALVISDANKLDDVIESSRNIISAEGKISRKKVIVIFAEQGSEYYNHLLSYIAPIIYAKSWTQMIKMRLCNADIAHLNEYGVESSPCLMVFSDAKAEKIIHGEENIEKVVKSLNMDINELIANL